MSEPTIKCPKCGTEIKLTESLAAPLLESTRVQFEQQLIEQRALITENEARKARRAIAIELDDKDRNLIELQEVLKERESKLVEAQKSQADLIRKQRELDDAKREIDLTVEKRVQDSLVEVRDRAKLEIDEELKLKVVEKEQTIVSMQRQIEELKRRAEQGSQQLQGEAQELELESRLRQAFPFDSIDPVPKGEHGVDIVHGIRASHGQQCGMILWEAKRTKKWNDNWLAKIRDDQRAAQAEVAVIVSQALPNGVDSFDLIDGIWVASQRCAIAVGIMLRHWIIEVSVVRQAGEGQKTKMELIYQYLTGQQFRHRIEAIVEKSSDLMADLEKERKSTTRLWAKREEQIRCVIESTAGMYGDLQGIAGRSLKEIEGLSQTLLLEDESDLTKESPE
jgi:hypothetical protein